jgi:hypothetical protein
VKTLGLKPSINHHNHHNQRNIYCFDDRILVRLVGFIALCNITVPIGESVYSALPERRLAVHSTVSLTIIIAYCSFERRDRSKIL